MAKLSAYVAPFLGAIVGALMACILKILGPYYPYAFTSTHNATPSSQFTCIRTRVVPQWSEDRSHALPVTFLNLSPIDHPSTHHLLPVFV